MPFNPTNMLVIDFGQLGDVVLSLPALRALREHFQRARITVMVGKPGAELVRLSNYANDARAVDRVALRDGNKLMSISPIFKLVQKVRQLTIDFIVDLHSLSEPTILGFRTRAS